MPSRRGSRLTDLRVTREAVESLIQREPNLRVTRVAVESLIQREPNLRVTRFGVEVLIRGGAPSPPVNRRGWGILLN